MVFRIYEGVRTNDLKTNWFQRSDSQLWFAGYQKFLMDL